MHHPRFRTLLPVALFVTLIVSGVWINTLSSFDTHVVRPLTYGLARSTQVLFSSLGLDIHSNGNVIWDARRSLEIYPGCNGLELAWIYVSGILAGPLGWKRKAAAILGGLPAIVLLNYLRLGSLWWLAGHRMDLMQEVHLYVWPLLAVVIIFGFWRLAQELGKARESSP